MSRITTILAGLALACLAALIPTAANAATTAGAVQADGTRVTSMAAQSVTVLDSGNDGAWVSGVGYCSNINVAGDCWTWIDPNNGTACPSGHFCIYTNQWAYQGGKVFSFYHCRNGGSDWALQAWNGWGYYHNSNTGGAHAYIKGASHNTLQGGDIAPGGAGSFYYAPAYYIQAC